MRNRTTLMHINGVPVYWDGFMIEYLGEMTCCADGAPNACAPDNKGLDYTGNAGYPGCWWGVVTDANGNPIIQKKGAPAKWPFPGYYVSCTAYKHSAYKPEDCRAWVDARNVAYSVIPSSVRMSVEPQFMGCRAEIYDRHSHKVLDCACAEVGPSNHMGEASMFVCDHFGLSSNPKDGGSSDKRRWRYRFWPGEPAEGWTLQ